MAFLVVTTDQRSEAWKAARLGRVTGSVAADIFATVKSGEAAKRRDLRTRLVLERLTGVSQEDGYVSRDMQRGVELEAEACRAYEAQTGLIVQPCGFLAHPELMCGCSPDGEIENYTGIVEFKAPKSATHLTTLRTRAVPTEYLHQCRHNVWLTGASWCDYVSYDGRFPPPLQLFIVRVHVTQAERDSHELTLRSFLREIDAEYAEVARMLMVAT